MLRSLRAQRILAIALILPAIAFWIFAGYVSYFNHRISRELLDHQWRKPAEIYGVSNSGEAELVFKAYGADWRMASPILLTEIPPHVANAFIAAEDVRFRSHFGIDPIGIGRAFFTNLRAGRIAQGGSTIPQQLVKSKFLTYERTYTRKFLELALAVVLDVRMTKDEILEAYLNDVYLGHSRGRAVLGVDEAARVYFSKKASRLTVGEAATIAGIIRAPNRDTPEKRPELARARRDAVLQTMQKRGWVSPEDFERAVAGPIRLSPGAVQTSPYPAYMSALRSELIRKEGAGVLTRAGLKVFCEMNRVMQKSAEDAVRRGSQSLRSRYEWIAESGGDDPLQVALFSMDPRTGGVRATIGGSDFTHSGFDRTVQMKRQPGSAFKTFAYLAAIESKKATASSLLLDSPLEIRLSSNETWEPHNYDERYRGRVSVREAFEKSLNVPTVRLTQQIGGSRVVQTADRFDFHEKFEPVPALPLGVTEVTLRELTSAYTAFPNLGMKVEPFLLREVQDAKGRRLYRRAPKKREVVSSDAAYVVHTLLRGVVQRGTASRLKKYGLSHVAGKTGTTNDYRDAWFIGYTPDLVTGVWVGFDRGAPIRLSSAEAALPIWAFFMREIPTDRREIAAPANVEFRNIDPESGFLWAEGCPGPFREAFLKGTAPTRGCPRGPVGKILRRILFDDEHFDEPVAITFDKFRRWASEIERNRQDLERKLEKARRAIEGEEDDDRKPRKEKRKRKEKERED